MYISNVCIFVLLTITNSGLIQAEEKGNGLKILSRRKRYVAFPEGSSFSTRPTLLFTGKLANAKIALKKSLDNDKCAACMTVGLIGQPAPSTAPGTFTFGMNWGIAYELPNNTETAAFYRGKKLRKPVAQRRSRRELYEKLEIILENMGYNGRQCILKTLCETTQRVVPHGGNMVEEIFRTMFTLPMVKVLPSEPLEHTIYDAAHRLGVLLDSCDNFYCPLSLVDLAKGYYNAPAPTVDVARSPWALFSSRFG